MPRTDGVLVKPSPDGGVAEGCRKTASADMGTEFGHAPTRKGLAAATGKFASDGLNLNDQFWGEKPGGGPGAGSLLDPPDVFRKNVFATD